jgi:hypothetical protein
METYTIKHPFLGKKDRNGFLELEIESKNIIYSELGSIYRALQCEYQKNHNEILVRCKEIADLIREIDELNKPTN